MPTKKSPRSLIFTEETVKSRVKNILDKLAAHDRTHAVTIGLGDHRAVITRKSERPSPLLGYRVPGGLDYADNGNLRLQRLYSTFARGWPGVGLLCLRLIAGITTFHCVMTGFVSDPSLLRILVEGAAGLLLCVGLWTPIAGTALSVVALWSAFAEAGDFWAKILLATMAAARTRSGPDSP